MKFNTNWEEFRMNLHKLWKADKYCDVILIDAEGKAKIPAHRLVLEASGTSFAGHISDAVGNILEMVVPAIDGATLHRLVGACYSGTMEMDENNLSSVYMGAKQLQLNSLLTIMDDNIIAQLNNSNCLHFYDIAEMCCRSNLYEAAENYICTHFIEISDHPSFLELDAKKLNHLLTLEALIVPSAEDLFRNVVKWIQHDLDRQQDYFLTELLPNLRLSTMSPKFLLSTVKPHCKTVATNAFIFAALEKQFECIPTVPVPELATKLESIPPVPSKVKLRDVLREQVIIVAGSLDEKKKIMGYCFDRQKWNTLAKLPIATDLFFVTHSKALNSLCIVGGCLNNLCMSDVILWNLETRKFTKSSNMIEPRTDAAVVSIYDDTRSDENGDLLVVGGIRHFNPLSTVECWSHKTGKSHLLKSIGESKFGARLVKVGNLIYCIGGHNLSFRFKSVECYNLSKKRWSTVASLHHDRFHCGVMNDGGKVYVIGGGSEVIECYLPRKNKWIEVCTVPGSMNVETCVRHNDRLIALGRHILLTSDGDWKKWKHSDIIKATDEYIYSAFSVPLQ